MGGISRVARRGRPDIGAGTKSKPIKVTAYRSLLNQRSLLLFLLNLAVFDLFSSTACRGRNIP
jgi:hypothetical protein